MREYWYAHTLRCHRVRWTNRGLLLRSHGPRPPDRLGHGLGCNWVLHEGPVRQFWLHQAVLGGARTTQAASRGRERSRPLTFSRDAFPRRLSVTSLFVAVSNPPTRQVVWREIYSDPVALQDPDVILAHLAADVRQHLVPVLELHA